MAVIDPEGTIVASTPSLDRMLGCGPGELVGVNGLGLIHPHDVEHVALRLAEYVGGGNDGPDVRTRLRRADDTYAHVELVAPDSTPINDELGGIVLTVRDITQKREAEEALRDVRILHEAVASVAARFVDADATSVDHTINQALELMGQAAAVDRAYVFSVTDDLQMMTNTHEWCAPGINPEIATQQAVPLGGLPRWRDTLERGHSIHIRRVSELEDDWRNERVELQRQGIRSVVAVPLMNAGRLRGFIGFDSVVRDRTWDDDTIRMLRTVVGILASLLARCEAQRDAHVHEARYRALVKHSSDTIVLLDRNGQLMFSAGRSAPLGYEPETITGMAAMDFIHPDDHPLAGQAIGKLLNGAAHAGPFEMRLRDSDGEWVPVEVEASNLLDNPAVGGIVVGFRDIRERLRAEHELRESEARLRTLVKNIPGAVYRCEATPPYIDEFVSEAVFELTGYTADQFIADDVLFDSLILPGHRERSDRELDDALSTRRPFVIEYPIRHRDGSVRWIVEQGQPAYDADGNPEWLDGVMFDVTERKHLEERLAHDAAHDPLTGLPNRTLLLETLNLSLKRASRTHMHVAVLFLDLDRFKLVNDALGHAAGDDLLIAFAARLQGVLRSSDLAARTGGDEFVVVCTDMESPIDAEHLAHRIAMTLGTPFELHGREVFVTASIGIAVAEDHSTGGELVRYADAAAYRAKERGRNCYEVFDEELRAATATALETETALHRALAEDQLRLHFQPIVNLETAVDPGLRGAPALGTPAAGARRPGSVPGRGRGLGAHRADRVSGRGARVRGAGHARRPADARGEPLTARARATGPRRADLLDVARRGRGSDPPVPRDHRERAARGRGPGVDHARPAQGCRRPARDRRLRHRVLVAQLPAAAPGRHREDRPFVRRRARPRWRGRHDHRRHHRADARSRPGSRRRGHRAPRAGSRAPGARLHPGSGLPVLARGPARPGDGRAVGPGSGLTTLTARSTAPTRAWRNWQTRQV